MRIGVLGINFKLADLSLREDLAKVCQKRFGMGEFPYIVLSTCNRTEVYFHSYDLAETHSSLLSILREEIEVEFDQKLYSYFGAECFYHLAKVATGLDSAIIAETEIQSQVKAAYEKAQNLHSLPSELHFLFQKCLKISKQVRSELPMGRGMPNLEHAILYTGMQIFEDISNAKVLFVGASDINQNVIRLFQSKKFPHLTLCNRTQEHAEKVASYYNISVMPWQQLSQWPEFDWIIFGTKSPEHLIHQKHMPYTACGQKLIIDLSVPRNVDPRLGSDPRIKLLNIDQMNKMLRIRRKGLAHTIVQAENKISQASQYYAESFLNREKNKLRLNFSM